MNDHLSDLQISTLHDGESPRPEEKAGMVAHLDRCPDCSRRLLALQALSNAVTTAGLPVLSQIARHRMRRNVLAATAERSLLRLAEVCSGLAAAVVIGGLMWLNHSSITHRPASVESASIEAAPPWIDTAAPLSPKVHEVTDTPAARWYLADTASHVEEAL